MTDAAAAQSVARQIRCALFAELHFLSSIERAWSGYGPLAWNGYNWLGLGTLGQVSMITEDGSSTRRHKYTSRIKGFGS